jgi:Fur family ferric uptake transcriptional regulator
VTLHEAGYRFTSQRRRILDVLRDGKDHPSAEDIYTQLRRRGERVPIGTIYRTVGLLEKIGLVRKINLGDRNRYEFLDSHSDAQHCCHLVCERCDRIINVSMDILVSHAGCFEKLASEVDQTSGFQVSGYQLRLFGICHKCL